MAATTAPRDHSPVLPLGPTSMARIDTRRYPSSPLKDLGCCIQPVRLVLLSYLFRIGARRCVAFCCLRFVNGRQHSPRQFAPFAAPKFRCGSAASTTQHWQL